MLRTLTQKVTLVALLLLGFFVVAAAVAIANILDIQNAATHLGETTIEQVELSGQFNTDMFRGLAEALSYAHTRQPDNRDLARQEMRDAKTLLDQLGAFDAQPDSYAPELMTEQRQLQQRRDAIYTQFPPQIEDLLQAVESNNAEQMTRALAVLNAQKGEVEQLEEDSGTLADKSIAAATNAAATRVRTAIISTGVAFGVLVMLIPGLLILLQRRIVQPVKGVAAAAQDVAMGHLDHALAVTSNDEIGDLQGSFNQMVQNLRSSRTIVAEQQRGIEERTAKLAQTNEELHTEIVERMQAEATLEGERALLAQRVAESTADLSAANAELARAARLKDEFLASMSHELRTPLNTILGMAETVQEGVLGSINDEQTDALRHIEESGRHLLALINDILDLSKVEAGKLDLNVEAVEVVVVAQASLRLISELARQKKLHIVSSIDSTVGVLQADARRLKQMLVNLLSNAVKFTPEGGTIGLEVVGDPAAQLVRLTVWDTGIGIAADDLPRLFQPFVQLDSRLARHYTGTGLGLALVDRMAAVHGGNVAVESTLGHGTRFTITLPWAATPSPADSVATLDRAELPAVSRAPIRRALVIEDSPTAATQLARYLRELGAEARVHPCGAGTLEVVLDVGPDVILLDIQLPDRSGWDVLAQLKADPRVRGIPVVVVSVVDDRAHALALGAAAYLVKPISRQQLQDALDTLPSGGVFHTLDSALTVAPSPPPATPAPVILLAEDEANNIHTLSTYLEAKGYQVVVARNGAEALECAHAIKPALILMDIQMPGMDGLEAIQRIRAKRTLGRVPIIALTALAMPGDRERCLAAGADEYLTKPVSLKGLVTAIEAHLQHPAASTEAIL